MTKVDLLVFGPHPDDIEIGFGGAVALHAARGFRVGLCDLTRGELGSNGTVEDRLAEAEAARAVLGADWRINLEWPDGGIYETPDHVVDIVRLVRAARPRVVALPYWNDRHPDHRAASEALSRAVFTSGLRRFTIEGGLPAFRPERVCYYFINDEAPVSFGLDISSVYDKKRQALDCHRTQFTPSAPDSVPTRLTAPTFRQLIEARDAHLGARTGVAYAEGVIVREPLLRASLFDGAPV
ncbi:MAG TPA: bacillithiol biosynthesis deacetylase BshB1 [Vicinamibacterales bacterium]|nr:bacillithiol biosynthesis deacetylase BshB1 [Vicinamibacterales bacterium]